MVIVLDKHITSAQKQQIRDFLESKKYQVREIVGKEETIFGAVGVPACDPREVELLPGVVQVIPISKPYKLASRELKKEDSIVRIGPINIGGNRIVAIAGPCAVESREQIIESARLVRASGAVILRGGAYKPRTSPYSFQGLAEEGLRYLKEAGELTGMPVSTEVVATEDVEIMRDYIDLYQIGARNMQNFELLKRVGKTGMPVILKRGMSATIEEWLMAAEYLLAHGTDNVILCERGIRTFETYTRNTLDISAIPVVKKLSHLPVIVDPSHATGLREKVTPMALAAVAAGADGVIVEVHPNPAKALSDGPQSLFPEQFEKLMRDIQALSPVVGKEVARLPVPSVSLTSAKAPTATGNQLKIAFQGEHGAYSEMALHAHFEQPSQALPFPTFEAVFNAVLDGSVDHGIVPVENSLAGSIHENYDLLLQYPDVRITGEAKLRIVHSLIATPDADLSDIRQVFSHPQGLAQCARFLTGLPGVKTVPFYDTAGSVAHIAAQKDKSLAAIASAGAADYYGMKVLKTGIETNPRNYTRFVILSRADLPAEGKPDKASIVFSTPDKPGSLFNCMKVLADHGLNLKKIESRPILGKPWQYMFYLDVELPGSVEVLETAIAELAPFADDLRMLGTYQAATT